MIGVGTSFGPAAATLIDVTGYDVPYNEGVSLSYAGTPLVTGEGGLAGQIHLTGPGGVSMYVWCVDIFHYLYVPTVFSTGLLTDSGSIVPPGALSSTTLEEILALIVNGDQLMASPPAGANLNQISAAIQVAIWSVEYGSLFSYSSGDAGLSTVVDQFIANVSGSDPLWTAPPGNAVGVLSTPGGQGLTVNQSQGFNDPVPEPATLLLFGTGFAGFVFARRRSTRP